MDNKVSNNISSFYPKNKEKAKTTIDILGLMNNLQLINDYNLSLSEIKVATKKQSKRILIVDDELFNINALMIMLRCFTSINPEEVCDTAMDGLDCIKKV